MNIALFHVPSVLCFCLHHQPNILMITAWIPQLPKCIVTCTLYFAWALTCETINSGEMLGTPTECNTFVIHDDAGQ